MTMLRITSLIFAPLVSWSACAQVPSKMRSSSYEEEFNNEIWNRPGVQLAQVPLTGAGKGAPGGGTTYQGPGDVVSGAVAWGSCARVYSSAILAGTSMCDLVDSAAPTVVICPLKSLATGFVDLASASCTGSVTPATKCTAATGGTCNISKVYDQIGATGGFVQATAANQPKLTFSALGGLPGMQFSGGAMVLSTAGTFTQAQPYAVSVVSERTNTSAGGVLEAANSSNGIDYGAAATAVCGSATSAATDSSFHAIQCTASGSTFTAVVDGSTASNAGAASMAGLLRFGRTSGGGSLTGIIMEGGVWPSAFNSTQYGAMNTNQHSAANGYNF